ncbi:MAG: tetratricopeptide repeat protein [Steroidobacteraceae bacterium]
MEASDVAAARETYRTALTTYRGHLEASINLGRLMHLDGKLDEAEKIYRAARHASATLSFNLALLLEDLHRDEEAVHAYKDALALEPTMHEAHLHLGLLHERRERPREALLHVLAFRRNSRR